MNLVQVKEAVRERAEWKCQDCGMPEEEVRGFFGCRLHVHRLDRSLGYQLGNCVALCHCCHGARHGCKSFSIDFRKPGRGARCALKTVVLQRDHLEMLTALMEEWNVNEEEVFGFCVKVAFQRSKATARARESLYRYTYRPA